MLATFITCFIIVVYTYAVYPAVIWLMARRRAEQPVTPRPAAVLPTVCMVIPVYNEAQTIQRKLRSLAALDYAPDKLRLLFVSDGSDDGTPQLLRRAVVPFKLDIIDLPERSGKAHALNLAMADITEEIVVFTDARQELNTEAIQRLTANLNDPTVGVVSGELVHVKGNSRNARNIGLYWKYEKFIRKAESRFDSTLGASGSLYAIRRKDYQAINPDTILDDFEIPMLIAKSGRRIVFESGAVAFDVLHDNEAKEQVRKVRTLSGNFQTFARHPWLFSPWRNRLFFQFVSHKVLRLVVPYALLGLVLTSGGLSGAAFQTFFALQVTFYAMAAAGKLLPRLKRFNLVSFPVVFTTMNLSAVIALHNFIGGGVDVRWQKT